MVKIINLSYLSFITYHVYLYTITKTFRGQGMLKELQRRYHEIEDLDGWRNWMIDVISLIFVFTLPLSLVLMFPLFIKNRQYILIIFDVSLWLLLLLRVFIPGNRKKIKIYTLLALFCTMTAGFFIILGPNYARPAWLITCAIMFAIFAGTKASLTYIALSSVFLVVLYFTIPQINIAWQTTHTDGLFNWLIYVLNTSLLSLLAALSTSFIIPRLGFSLDTERKTRMELQAAMEELEASNEEFEAINEELIHSQEELRASEIMYRELSELLPLTIFRCDTKGKIIYANPQAFKDFRYDASDLENNINIEQLFEDHERHKTVKLFANFKKHPLTTHSEFTMKRKDGTTFPSIIYIAPIKNNGSFSGILGAILDISQRVEMEKENRKIQEHLMQIQKLEAIGTLAGGIAHDFNNILTGIIGYTELARDCSSDNEVKENLSNVLKFSSRASDLVRQILALSRQHEFSKKPIDIVMVIDEAIKLLRASLPSTITIEMNDNSSLKTIKADSTEILQVIMNLGTNAAHAMKEHGGLLKIDVYNDKPSDTGSSIAKLIKIIISDTGKGIPENIINRIFDPFYTTKAAGEGTGLGLSISHSIIKDCGGTVTVSSSINQGTTFKITLPLYIGEIKVKNNIENEAYLTGTGNILVIDDEEPIAYMEKVMLEKLGYSVYVCNGGIEGLEVFKARPDKFDLIITDQTMPEITGAELTLEIRKMNPDIPVLLCTGYSEQVSTDNAASFGINSILYKPLTLPVLSNEVYRILNNKL